MSRMFTFFVLLNYFVLTRNVVNCAFLEKVLHFYSKRRLKSINFKRSPTTSLVNEIEHYISRYYWIIISFEI